MVELSVADSSSNEMFWMNGFFCLLCLTVRKEEEGSSSSGMRISVDLIAAPAYTKDCILFRV